MSKLLRILFRPTIRLVNWCIAQGYVLRNERLLSQLDCVDRTTVALYGQITIAHPGRCKIGRGVAIHDAKWNAMGSITIGNYVHIGPRVTILTVSHNYEGDRVPYDETVIEDPVVIEDNVWIGCDVVIAPGTHIEEGAIIAMGATVAGRIPRGAIVGAAKWRILKTRDLDHYEKLKAEGKFH